MTYLCQASTSRRWEQWYWSHIFVAGDTIGVIHMKEIEGKRECVGKFTMKGGKEIVLDHSVCCNKNTREWVAFKQQKLMFCSSGVWEVQDQDAGRLSV